MQEDQFHLVDNRPTKSTKFGQRRFQQNKYAQQRREREAARAEREKREGGGQQKQQKKNPWAQQHWREQQRVGSNQLSCQQDCSWAVTPGTHTGCQGSGTVQQCGRASWFDLAVTSAGFCDLSVPVYQYPADAVRPETCEQHTWSVPWQPLLKVLCWSGR